MQKENLFFCISERKYLRRSSKVRIREHILLSAAPQTAKKQPQKFTVEPPFFPEEPPKFAEEPLNFSVELNIECKFMQQKNKSIVKKIMENFQFSTKSFGVLIIIAYFCKL
jgi:hypothetical protein